MAEIFTTWIYSTWYWSYAFKCWRFSKIYWRNCLKHIFAQLGLNLVTPLSRIKYFDALRDYGTDKLDLRFG